MPAHDLHFLQCRHDLHGLQAVLLHGRCPSLRRCPNLPDDSMPVWLETKRLEPNTITLSMGTPLNGTVPLILGNPQLAQLYCPRILFREPAVTFMKLALQSEIQSIRHAYTIDRSYDYEHGFTRVIKGPQNPKL